MTERFSDIRILLVEDEADVRESFKSYLEPYGAKFSEAENGIKALRVLEKEKVHIMLLDLNMPQMDGLSLLSVVSKNYPNLISIIITGHSGENEMRRAFELNVFDYIVKPFETELFKRRVFNALKRARNQGLINEIIKEFIITHCDNISEDDFDNMSLERQNSVLKMGIELFKIQKNKKNISIS